MNTPQQLSKRQREVLIGIAIGKTTKQIALALGISIKTVEAHRTKLYEALEIYEVAGLTRYAIKHGLIEVD